MIGWRLEGSIKRGKIARSHQGELQRTRNRGGAHGQRVDVDFKLLELLFYGDAEFLLLVDDKQAKILKFHPLSDEFMRADENVYLPSARSESICFTSLGFLAWR